MERVIEAFLDEESAKRNHLVVALSGSHACGFDSPDSDFDLKAIHVAPTKALLSLMPPQPTFNRLETIDGVEIDYTSNELVHVLNGMIMGNGNYFERVLGPLVVRKGPLFDELVPLVRSILSRRVQRHYQGFARGQVAALAKEPKVKTLLYILRNLSTGIHLLREGELVTDLARLGGDDVKELVHAKRTGERYAPVDPALVESWKPRIEALFVEIDEACASSALPAEPPPEAVQALESWLVGVRLSATS